MVLSTHRMLPGKSSKVIDDAAIERMFLEIDSLSMGRALGDLRVHLAALKPPVVLPELDKARLGRVVEIRNFIAHQYFTVRLHLLGVSEAR